MRFFVTGATGAVGQSVVRELIQAKHQVLGLCRNKDKAGSIEALGAEVLEGTIKDLDILKQAASTCDGVVHLAFIHEFSDYMGACETDRVAIDAMCSALEGTNKPFLMTSGTLMAQTGKLITEDSLPALDTQFGAARGPAEGVALGFLDKGVRVCVMRFPPTVHLNGEGGFAGMLQQIAQSTGVSAYVAGSEGRWPEVNRLDAAVAYRLALEKDVSGVFHPVAEEGVPVKDIAEAIGKKLNLPVVTKTAEEAPAHFGFLAAAMVVDNSTSSTKTRERLGWKPTHATLLEELARS